MPLGAPLDENFKIVMSAGMPIVVCAVDAGLAYLGGASLMVHWRLDGQVCTQELTWVGALAASYRAKSVPRT